MQVPRHARPRPRSKGEWWLRPRTSGRLGEWRFDAARRLARQEGIFGGFSGGACLVAAEQLLRERHTGETIAIVIADSGMKYLSTDLWER
ncbi:MAG: hypothetical protein WD965_00770 [Actinomycetota bacterium]